MARKQTVDERLHNVFEKRAFGYATSREELNLLVAAVNARAGASKGRSIAKDYAFCDQPGGRADFDELIEKSGQDGHTGDSLYIPGLTTLGRSIGEVKEKLKALKSIGMVLYTIDGTAYDVGDLAHAIECVEALLPRYQREQAAGVAVALYRTERFSVDEIAQLADLPKSEVYSVLAEYEREREDQVITDEVITEEIVTEEE